MGREMRIGYSKGSGVRRSWRAVSWMVACAVPAVGCLSNDDGQDSDGSEHTTCSLLVAYRAATCFSRASIPVEGCTRGGEQRHLGLSQTCVLSPSGELFVIVEPHGASHEGAEGWVFLESFSDSDTVRCNEAVQSYNSHMDMDCDAGSSDGG